MLELVRGWHYYSFTSSFPFSLFRLFLSSVYLPSTGRVLFLWDGLEDLSSEQQNCMGLVYKRRTGRVIIAIPAC